MMNVERGKVASHTKSSSYVCKKLGISLYLDINNNQKEKRRKIKTISRHPIPSYNELVEQTGTTFEETDTSDCYSFEKKSVKVIFKKITSNSNMEKVDVLFYLLDKKDFIGPFRIKEEELLTVDIDERKWGLMVVGLDAPIYLSVWNIKQ